MLISPGPQRGQSIDWFDFAVLTGWCPGAITAGMPRKLRVEYPGAMYHVMSPGDRREAIFLDDVDRHDFMGLKHFLWVIFGSFRFFASLF